MYIQLKSRLKNSDWFLILSFLAGLIPASFIIHIIAVDFSGFYFQALSFLRYKSYAYQILTNYCDNPINTGVNARAPVVPFLLALSITIFGRNLLGIYLPFFIARILIFPVTYLVARYYLSKKMAFLSTLFLLFIPKLQTYSFSAFEADIFIALFYVLAFYFYLKSNKLKDLKYLIFSSVALGLGALTKSTCFSLALGFILAIFLENIKSIKRVYLFSFIFVVLVGPYLLWNLAVHNQLYLSTHKDKSINYILTNLPSLIKTIPLYLGINFIGGLKAKIIAASLLAIFLTGLLKSFYKKWFVLTFPTITTLILISILSTCLIGGNIPGSYEFITILGFTMIPSSIIFFSGMNKLPSIITYVLIILIMFKFINNYFSSPYTLEFIPGEYYISLPTVIKNKQEIPDVRFKMENGLRIFDGPSSHREIRKQFNNFRFDPFSSFYKRLVLGFTIIAFIATFLAKEKKI